MRFRSIFANPAQCAIYICTNFRNSYPVFMKLGVEVPHGQKHFTDTDCLAWSIIRPPQPPYQPTQTPPYLPTLAIFVQFL